MLVYQDLLTNDELLSDSFPYTELFNGVLWEVEGKWVVQGAVDVDIGANPSAEGGEDEAVDDQAVKVVDIVDTFRLQEQPAFDKKQFVTFIKRYIKLLTPKLEGEKLDEFKKNIEGATKFLLSKLNDLQFFVGESMHDDSTLVFSYYKEVKESKYEGGRGGGGARGTGRGRGRGGGEFNRDSFNKDSTYDRPPMPYKGSEEGEGKTFERRGGYGGPRGSFRGGRRGGFSNGDVAEGERPRRVYERHSGTGRDNGVKRDGAGRGNWGTPTDEIAPETEESPIQKEKVEDAEKQSGEEDSLVENKEKTEEELEEKEPEAKEMTLEEYEKVLEEKRKALVAMKTEERKVDDKEFKSMQQISSKKNNDEIFAKLGNDKDKRKEVAEKEEKVKKSVNITEFLKPAEGERSYGGRGRGRGRGPRGGFNGGSYKNNAPPANIEDPGHFPALGVK